MTNLRIYTNDIGNPDPYLKPFISEDSYEHKLKVTIDAIDSAEFTNLQPNDIALIYITVINSKVETFMLNLLSKIPKNHVIKLFGDIEQCRLIPFLNIYPGYAYHLNDGDMIIDRIMLLQNKLENKFVKPDQVKLGEVLLKAAENLPEGIIVTDPKQDDNPIVYASKGVERITGYKSEEVIGINPRIFKLKTPSELQQALSDSIKAKKEFRGQIFNRTKDGNPFWNDISITPLFDSNGDLEYYVGIQRNATDKKNLEKQLNETSTLFREIQDVAEIGFWRVDILNMTTHWSDITCRIHGVPKGTVMSVDEAIKYYREDFRDLVNKSVEDAIIRKGKFEFEAVLVREDGGEVWVQSIGYPVFVDGEVIEIRGLFQNIEERKRDEEEAHKSREVSEMILNTVNDLICLHSLDGTYIRLSPSIEIITGYRPEELVGKDPYDYFHPDDKLRIKTESHQPLIEGNKPSAIEYRFRHKEGHYVWLLTNSAFILDENKEPNMIVTSSTDFTKVKQRDQEISDKIREALEYQSMLLSSQINPHFIFNALNAMQAFILNQDVEKGVNFISNFAKLMRGVLSNSMSRFISLSDEIQWLAEYMKLEQLRFDEKFSFSIETLDEIDIEETMIPPMILQPFVENSIIHGIGPKSGRGEIRISFSLNDNSVNCKIEDDGVGREYLRTTTNRIKHKSYGVGITDEKIQLLNQIDGAGYSFKVIDKYDNVGNAAGTDVIVDFPYRTKV